MFDSDMFIIGSIKVIFAWGVYFNAFMFMIGWFGCSDVWKFEKEFGFKNLLNWDWFGMFRDITLLFGYENGGWGYWDC